MERVVFKADGKRIPIYVDKKHGVVFTTESCCPDKVRQTIKRFMHNPKLTADDRAIYLAIPNPKLRLTPEGKRIAKRVKNSPKVKTNPIGVMVAVLVAILGVSIVCNYFPDLKVCKMMGKSWWNVVFPVLSFSLGAMSGVYVGRSLAR